MRAFGDLQQMPCRRFRLRHLTKALLSVRRKSEGQGQEQGQRHRDGKEQTVEREFGQDSNCEQEEDKGNDGRCGVTGRLLNCNEGEGPGGTGDHFGNQPTDAERARRQVVQPGSACTHGGAPSHLGRQRC